MGGIEAPNRGFLTRCRAKIREDGKDKDSEPELEFEKAGSSGEQTTQDYAAAEVDVSVGEQHLHQWVVKYSNRKFMPGGLHNDAFPLHEKDNMSAAVMDSGKRHKIIAVALTTQTGPMDHTYQVLVDVSNKIFDLGVDQNSLEACQGVKGNVRLLSTSLPCLSSV